MANILPKEKQEIIIGALAEGNSIRSIERLSGIHRDTIMRLGARVGQTCAQLLDQKMRGLNCSRIEIDELWGFIGKKQARASQQDRRIGLGDAWTFLSIDPATKLMPSFLVGKRDRYHAVAFMEDLASRLNNRIQLSSDAMAAYPDAVEMAFGAEIDYAQIVKEYAIRLRPVRQTLKAGDSNFATVSSVLRPWQSFFATALVGANGTIGIFQGSPITLSRLPPAYSGSQGSHPLRRAAFCLGIEKSRNDHREIASAIG
jgi:hypothetical protein